MPNLPDGAIVSLSRISLWAALAAGCVAPSAAAALTPRQEQIVREHVAARAEFEVELDRIAATCVADGLPAQAEIVRQAAQPFDAQAFDVELLPDAVQPDLPPTLTEAELRWRTELRTKQQAYAQRVYLLAQRAIREGQGTYALQLVREAAFHHPDHEHARRVLGHVLSDGRWTTPFTKLMLGKGYVDDPQFGWLPESHVTRYQQGERYYQGRWISAAIEAERRRDIAAGWVVESDYFRVRTNHSLERAVELSRSLDDLHRYFLREFSGLFSTPQQMQALFDDGKPRSTTSDKHDVWYFRTPEEFAALIQKRQPGLVGVNGAYLPDDRKSYFFAVDQNPERNIETMYHEVTHQILSESSRAKFQVAEDRDFWIVEGIACYMESFERTGGRLNAGAATHPRLYWARERVATEAWFIPTEQFTAFGRRDFQEGNDTPTLQKYYSQATGLTHFLLHFDGGRYRDGCIEYLGQLYSPDKRVRLRPRGLDEILGVAFKTLDAQYREYITALETQPPG